MSLVLVVPLESRVRCLGMSQLVVCLCLLQCSRCFTWVHGFAVRWSAPLTFSNRSAKVDVASPSPCQPLWPPCSRVSVSKEVREGWVVQTVFVDLRCAIMASLAVKDVNGACLTWYSAAVPGPMCAYVRAGPPFWHCGRPWATSGSDSPPSWLGGWLSCRVRRSKKSDLLTQLLPPSFSSAQHEVGC